MWTVEGIKGIDIELTTFCNLECPGCYRANSNTDNIKNTYHQNIDQLLLKVEQFPNLEWVSFCGNIDEPTMHPHYEEAVEYMRERNVKTFTSTNGNVRTPKWWYDIGKRFGKANTISWSIDGASQDAYSQYRVGGNLEIVLSNAEHFIRGGGRAIWQFIVFDHNKHEVEIAREMSKDIGFDIFRTKDARTEDKNIEIEDKPIECQYYDEGRIQIVSNGNWAPCCWLSSSEVLKKSEHKPVNEFMTELDKLYQSTLSIDYLDVCKIRCGMKKKVKYHYENKDSKYA